MTRPIPTLCGLYTQDARTAEFLGATLRNVVALRHYSKSLPESVVPHLWLVDLRTKGYAEVVRLLTEQVRDLTLIVFGTPGSEPWREAAQMNAYCLVDAESQAGEWQHIVARAAERADLLREVSELRRAVPVESRAASAPTLDSRPERCPPMPFPAARRSFGDTAAVLRSLVEDLAQWTQVTRAGLFSCSDQHPDRFTLRAGFRALPGTSQWVADRDDVIPQWFQRSLQFVLRSRLDRIPEIKLRDLLAQAMEDWGAEVVIPLQLREKLVGWLFFGPLLTGRRLDEAVLAEWVPMADHAVTILDNVLLYETTAFQRSLIEIVLQTMPTGVVVVDRNGLVQKCNEAACAIFGCAAEQVLRQPVENVSASLAELLKTALRGDAPADTREWTEAASRRHLAGYVRPLPDEGGFTGAVAFVHDQTVEKLLASKQEQVERAAFWTELAAAMSHEVRNPLVAIKTFAQLLPERYSDKEFRTEFARTVNCEVGRLENIIEQIHQFAHPPPLVLSPVNLPRVIQRAIDLALSGTPGAGVWVETAIAEDLPAVEGDENALSQCLAHLVTNAAEALRGRVNPKIVISAQPIKERNDAFLPGLFITVQDNGPGIPADIRAKVFSPFCTTKARGLGLGLPIAKRIIIDHGGQLDIETGERGTNVYIRLPASSSAHARAAKPTGNAAQKRK